MKGKVRRGKEAVQVRARKEDLMSRLPHSSTSMTTNKRRITAGLYSEKALKELSFSERLSFMEGAQPIHGSVFTGLCSILGFKPLLNFH